MFGIIYEQYIYKFYNKKYQTIIFVNTFEFSMNNL